jgi:hypothetical protein
MHPTIAQGFVQHHQAALHQEAQQSRLAAQARAGRPGRPWPERVAALAGRLRAFGSTSHLADRAQARGQASAAQVAMAVPAQDLGAQAPGPGADPVAAGPRRPASWARARAISFGPTGRTLSGPSDVTPPSPAL